MQIVPLGRVAPSAKGFAASKPMNVAQGGDKKKIVPASGWPILVIQRLGLLPGHTAFIIVDKLGGFDPPSPQLIAGGICPPKWGGESFWSYFFFSPHLGSRGCIKSLAFQRQKQKKKKTKKQKIKKQKQRTRKKAPSLLDMNIKRKFPPEQALATRSEGHGRQPRQEAAQEGQPDAPRRNSVHYIGPRPHSVDLRLPSRLPPLGPRHPALGPLPSSTPSRSPDRPPRNDISLVTNIYFIFCRTNSVRDLIFRLILYVVNYGRVGKYIMRKPKRYPLLLDGAFGKCGSRV
jgi:hypothetical protein